MMNLVRQMRATLNHVLLIISIALFIPLPLAFLAHFFMPLMQRWMWSYQRLSHVW